MLFVPKCIRFPNGQLLLGLAKNYEKGKCPFVFNYYNVHLQPITIILHSKCNKNSLDSRCSKVKIQAQNYKKIKPQWHLYCELFAKAKQKIVESKYVSSNKMLHLCAKKSWNHLHFYWIYFRKFCNPLDLESFVQQTV